MGDKLICITKNRKAMKIIILHDADARIEYLDVADHLLGSDIEEFLTRQGFSVNNITWLVAHPTNPVEGCADANPKTELPNDT